MSSPTPSSSTSPCGTVAQLLIDYLKAEGVDKIFGIPGGAAVWLMNELKKQSKQIDYVICRHESGAAYIADGYARVKRNLGVVLTTSGPGATNALTGAMNAQASNSPVLVITGEVPEAYYGKGYLQEGTDAKLDVHNIYLNALASSALISSPLNFQTLFQQALRNALSLPRQAVHISLPNDIAGTCVPNYPASVKPITYRPMSAASTDAKAVDTALHDLVHAKRPLIFLGNGARDALAEPQRLTAFTEFVDRFGMAVMTTPDAKGIFPEGDALSLRNYGICGCAWPSLYMHPTDKSQQFDALMVLGSSLGELSTTVTASALYSPSLEPTEHFIQVDLNPAVIGRDFPITQGLVAEIGATLDLMCEKAHHLKPDEAKVKARKEIIKQIKHSNAPWADPAGRDSEAAPVHPAAMMRVVDELVHEGHVFIDAGNCVGWSLNNMVVNPPVRYHSALAMGPMGFAVGAVIGGKMAAPDLPSVGIVGDGAFMMHGAEISTAAQNRVGAIWIVLDDNDLAMVSQGMAQLLPPAKQWDDYYKLGQPDLAKFAEGLGARAVTIAHDQGTAAFREALKHALEDAHKHQRPNVIVARINTQVAPPYGWPKLTPADCCTPPSGKSA
ncbi:MAG: thiamine pyrophosphate-binding protein [Burkholderiales bacterium]|jgi:acetolactate synthase-1/2/3 large subunit|nr:MAG: thiamine pyrophosphate-binding protein [Burkholderiales bacterium]